MLTARISLSSRDVYHQGGSSLLNSPGAYQNSIKQTASEAAFFGRRAASRGVQLGRLAFNAFGLPLGAAGAAAAGISRFLRLSIDSSPPSGGYGAPGAVTIDYDLHDRLRLSVGFTQQVSSLAGDTVTATTLQTHFPGMTTDEGRTFLRTLSGNVTTEGNFVELYLRLLTLLIDVERGCVVPGNPQGPLNSGNVLWPSGAGTYAGMLAANNANPRVYYIVGDNGRDYDLTGAIADVLWTIAHANNNVPAGLQGQTLSGSPTFNSAHLTFLIGARTIRNCSAQNAGGVQQNIASNSIMQTIDWLLGATGDFAGLEHAFSLIARTIPYSHIHTLVTNVPRENRVGPGDAVELGALAWLRLYKGLILLWRGQAVDQAALIVSYNALVAPADALNPGAAMPPLVDGGAVDAQLFPDGFVQGHPHRDSFLNLFELFIDANGLNFNETSPDPFTTSELQQLYAVALSDALAMISQIVEVGVVVKRVQHNQGARANLSLNLLASQLPMMAAVGADVSGIIRITNGANNILAAVRDPTRFGKPVGIVSGTASTPANMVLSIFVHSLEIRCVADDVARTTGQSSILQSLCRGILPPGTVPAVIDRFHVDNMKKHFGSIISSNADDSAMVTISAHSGIFGGTFEISNSDLRYVCPDAYPDYMVPVALTPAIHCLVTGYNGTTGGAVKDFSPMARSMILGANILNVDEHHTDLTLNDRLNLLGQMSAHAGVLIGFDYLMHVREDVMGDAVNIVIPGYNLFVCRFQGTTDVYELGTNSLYCETFDMLDVQIRAVCGTTPSALVINRQQGGCGASAVVLRAGQVRECFMQVPNQPIAQYNDGVRHKMNKSNVPRIFAIPPGGPAAIVMPTMLRFLSDEFRVGTTAELPNGFIFSGVWAGTQLHPNTTLPRVPITTRGIDRGVLGAQLALVKTREEAEALEQRVRDANAQANAQRIADEEHQKQNMIEQVKAATKPGAQLTEQQIAELMAFVEMSRNANAVPKVSPDANA